jgi:hypothetical protein
LEVGRYGRLTAAALLAKRDQAGADAVVLWLGPTDLAEIAESIAGLETNRVYVSSTLNDGNLETIEPSIRAVARVAHPFSMPDEFERRYPRVRSWLNVRGIEGGDDRLLAQTYFACMIVGEALMHIRHDYFFREYFIEAIDHFAGASRFSVSLPRPSFGPGQRFLSKGCYVVEPRNESAGDAPETARWIVP